MGFLANLLMVLLLIMAVFLIVLVLIQRGKGGGLSGAFGGMGGQSAFGTKAGDLFTRITIVVASIWIILCLITVKVLSVNAGGPLNPQLGGAASAPANPGAGATKGEAGKNGAAQQPAGSAEKNGEKSAPASSSEKAAPVSQKPADGAAPKTPAK